MFEYFSGGISVFVSTFETLYLYGGPYNFLRRGGWGGGGGVGDFEK